MTESIFFNHTTHWPQSWWEQNSFLRAWWRLYAGDPRWSPPDYRTLHRLVHSQQNPFLARLHTQPIYLEALPQRRSTHLAGGTPVVGSAVFEETVAAALVQVDKQRGDGTAYLSLLRCANDEETLERLLDKAMEYVARFDCARIVGPLGPLPCWQNGVLQNYFHLTPPLHTPYNPPYLPDIMANIMEPWQESVLYTMAVAQNEGQAPPGPSAVEIVPLTPNRLAADLLPLLAVSVESTAEFPPPDAEAAGLLLSWLGAFPLTGWLAQADDTPVGFVLVQPDLAEIMRRAGGGRNWLGQAYAAWHKLRPTTAGRLLLGAVDPAWQGQGVGLQLWRQVLAHARASGWRTLTCGPVAPDSAAAQFLARQDAHPQQRYVLYEWTPW